MTRLIEDAPPTAVLFVEFSIIQPANANVKRGGIGIRFTQKKQPPQSCAFEARTLLLAKLTDARFDTARLDRLFRCLAGELDAHL